MRRTEKRRNKDLNEEAITLIRDINVMVLGILEDDKTPVRSIQRLMLSYFRECEEYYSRRSRGKSLPAAVRRFGAIFESLMEFRMKDFHKINEEHNDD